MKKIAVYGGSFDPPHKGHRLLSENLARACGADKVIIIPAASSPFKNGSFASGEDRLEMCRRAFDDALFEINDMEIKRGGKSYTVDTLREIKKLYPDSRLFLFMGDDMLLSFHRWYEYKEILRLAEPVCAHRGGNASVLKEMLDYSENVLGLKSGEIIICDSEPIEISSTEIRSGSDEIKRRYLKDAVYEYIIQRGLYK